MRKLLYAISLILITCLFNSCELLGDGCQVCQTVTYENDHPVAWGIESEYCGQDLIDIKRIPPAPSGDVITYWECR